MIINKRTCGNFNRRLKERRENRTRECTRIMIIRFRIISMTRFSAVGI